MDDEIPLRRSPTTKENAAQSGSLSTISLIDRIAACTEAAALPPLKLIIIIIEKPKTERRATRFRTECSLDCHDPVRKSVSSLAVTSGGSSGKKCPLLSTLTMRTFEAFGAREAFSHS